MRVGWKDPHTAAWTSASENRCTVMMLTLFLFSFSGSIAEMSHLITQALAAMLTPMYTSCKADMVRHLGALTAGNQGTQGCLSIARHLYQPNYINGRVIDAYHPLVTIMTQLHRSFSLPYDDKTSFICYEVYRQVAPFMLAYLCKDRACTPSVPFLGHLPIVRYKCFVQDEPQGHTRRKASPTLPLAKSQPTRGSISTASSHVWTSTMMQPKCFGITSEGISGTASSWADTSAFEMTLHHVGFGVRSMPSMHQVQAVLARHCCGDGALAELSDGRRPTVRPWRAMGLCQALRLRGKVMNAVTACVAMPLTSKIKTSALAEQAVN